MAKKKTITPAKIVEMAVATEEKEIMEPLEHSTTTTPEVPKGKTMVNSDALEQMLARMDKLEAETAELKKENEELADKARLAKYRSKTAAKQNTIVKLGKWGGKVITGWDSLDKNLCEKSANGAWVEQLERTLHLEDGTTATVPYIESARHIERIDATIMAEKITQEEIDNDGNCIKLLDLIDEDGNKWTIDDRFVNP